MHLDPVTLTYISRFIDLVNFYVEVWFSLHFVIVASVKLGIVIVLDMVFMHAPRPSALDLYFTFLVIFPDAGAISTSAAFLFPLVGHSATRKAN